MLPRLPTFRCLGLQLALLLTSLPAIAASGLSQPVPVGGFLDGAFPANTPGSNPGTGWQTLNAFPNLKFVEPVRLLEHPTQDMLVVVSKDGQIVLIADDPAANQKQMLLDLRGKIDTTTVGESGIGGFIFHPDFGNPSSPNRGYVYVWYRWSPAPGNKASDAVGYNRLSRFTVPDGSLAANPASELVMIQQFDREMFHIGGAMFFGPDGYLYVSLGDEGNCCPRTLSTQRLDFALWSGIIRIDVDKDPTKSHPIIRQPQNPANPPAGWPSSFTQGYFIPNDNPFVDSSGGTLEEFYALGLRHPWTVTPDPQTGNVWIGDVGQNKREEVDILARGANYQWAYKEGTLAGLITKPSVVIGQEKPPVWEYDHSVGIAVIGAGVYRGGLHPSLFGKYLFSDFTGELWTLELVDQQPSVTQIATLPGGFSGGINDYLLAQDGRILMAKTSGGLDPNGTILELVPQGSVTDQPPPVLSQTNAFQNLDNLQAHPGCVPYDLNVPFWSDGAAKTRWMCIPNDGSHDTPAEKIGFSVNGEWTLPVGSVLIKHFDMPMSDVNPSITRRLETRFLVHGEDGYYGVTYRWRPDGTDADLLASGQNETLVIATASGTRQQVYHYPSRPECMECHNSNAGGVLGPKTRQLNRNLLYPATGIVANQLETLNHLGMLSPAINPADIPGYLTSTPTQSSTGTLTAKARSYLDSNCSHCHRPGGVRANFDARLTTPLDQQGLVNGALVEPTGVPGEAVIVPGSLTRSILYVRANKTSANGGMPPLSKNLVDAAGVSLLGQWIDSLAGFTAGNPTTSDAGFIDAHHPSLYINEKDTFTNQETFPLTVTPATFDFYARKVGNPVTPIVVKVNGDNQFTVVAIGTTRTGAEYFTGSNSFAFTDSGAPSITLQAGETVAAGFMDSFPDGTGWGDGTVIPAVTGSSEDEIWALLPNPLILATDGFVPGRDTPAVVVGESPLVTNAGKAVQQITTLKRSYRFNVGFTFGSGSGGGGNTPPELTNPGAQFSTVGQNVSLTLSAADADADPLAFDATNLPPGLGIDSISGEITGTATTAGSYAVSATVSDGRGGSHTVQFSWTVSTGTIVPVQNGSFEQPNVGGGSAFFFGTEIPGWTVVSGSVDIVGTKHWAGSDGVQSVDLAGNAPGTLQQSVSGLAAGTRYEVVFDYAINKYGSGTRTADILVDGAVIGSVTSSKKAPSYTEGRFAFTAPVDGQIVLAFKATSAPATGVVIDAVHLEELGGGGGNSPPQLTNPGAQTNDVGDGVMMTLNASDADGDTLSFSATSLPPALALNAGNGLLSGTLTTAGSYDVTATVDDGNGGTDSVSFNWSVAGTGGGAAAVTNGSFEQPNVAGGSIIYTGTEIPGWTITSGNVDIVGTKHWTGSDGVQSLDLAGNTPGTLQQSVAGLTPGTQYDVVFDYAINKYGKGTRTADVLVDGAVIGSVSSSQKAPGYTVGRFGFTAPADGQIVLAFKATSAPATGIVIDRVRVEAVGGGGNSPPQLANPGNRSDPVGANVTLTMVATDADGDPLSFSAQNLPPGLIIGALNGEISGTVDTAGAYNTTVTVNDGNGGSDSVSFVWNVGGGAGSIANGSFEADEIFSGTLVTGELTGWTVDAGNVELIAGSVFAPPDGDQSLDLNGDVQGGIVQQVGGLTPSAPYVLRVSYADQAARGASPALATADVLVNGVKVGDIRTTADAPTFVTCNGFEFTSSASGGALVALRSTLAGGRGVVVDDVFLTAGTLPAPPAAPTLVNGSFDAPYGRSDPHLCGDQLPGWRVTRENVDIVAGTTWPPFTGSSSLDLNGHGPGGIAQTVTGLVPGQTYTLAFAYGRHKFWGSAPMTADVLVNGSVVRQLSATTANIPPAWLTASIPVTASAAGRITIEFRSTVLNQGGGLVLDDVRLD